MPRGPRVAVGMTLLLLGVAACGTSRSADGVSSPSTASTASRVRPESPSAAATKPTASRRSSASEGHPPPYIARVVWVSLPSGRSLQVYPTASGRVTTADGAEDEAWREVVRKARNAETPSMRAQFDCHWAFARLAERHKPSWNLEPWRPVVSAQQMYDDRCNPGAPEV